MGKCTSCGERKGNRFCPALKAGICSLCCGEKREKEILCSETCEYLSKGKDYQLGREIEKRINSDLRSESADVFEMEEVVAFVMSLERFFVDQFYRDQEANDTRICEALTKIYAFQTKMIPGLKGENRTEELIFKKFIEISKRAPGLSERLKERAVLRVIKSIRSSSGSVLGNRNYLEMIYSQHTGKGKWADLFGKLESDK